MLLHQQLQHAVGKGVEGDHRHTDGEEHHVHHRERGRVGKAQQQRRKGQPGRHECATLIGRVRDRPGHQQCAQQPPHAHRGQQRAVAARPEPQLIAGNDRHERKERAAQHRPHRDQRQQVAHRPRLGQMPQPLGRPGRTALDQLMYARDREAHSTSESWHGELDEHQPPEHRHEAQGVNAKAPRNAKLGDHQAANGRPDHAGQVEPTGIQGDGRLQIVAPHQLNDHALAGGNLDRAAQPLHKSEHQQNRDRHMAGNGDQPEHRRLRQEDALCHSHDAQLVAMIHKRAGVHGEKHDRHGPHRRHQPDHEDAVGELEGQPAHGHRLHPGADEGHRLPDPEDPEIPVAGENAEGV